MIEKSILKNQRKEEKQTNKYLIFCLFPFFFLLLSEILISLYKLSTLIIYVYTYCLISDNLFIVKAKKKTSLLYV